MKPTRGIVLISESMMRLNSGTTVMILSTLIILNKRATKILSTLEMGTREITTIQKSKIFQPS